MTEETQTPEAGKKTCEFKAEVRKVLQILTNSLYTNSDVLVEEAWKVPGVIGSRMTGGGFGGCTVSIVKDDAIETFEKQVGEAYKKRIGYDCTFYVVSIGDGPSII